MSLQAGLGLVGPIGNVRLHPQPDRECIFLESERCLGAPFLLVIEEQRRKLLSSVEWWLQGCLLLQLFVCRQPREPAMQGCAR